MPILGDAYILGNDLEKGFKNLTLKHGKICGLWLGPQRAVVVSDFEILQEMLNKPETSDRQIWAVAGNYHYNYFNTVLNMVIQVVEFSIRKILTICPIHVVTFNLISILATDYIQKRRGQALLSLNFSDLKD